MEHSASRLPDERFGATSTGLVRAATPDDAPLVYRLYRETPDYFRIISIPMPTLEEVERELEAAQSDPRRCTELVLDRSGRVDGLFDPASGEQVVGYLDYKLHYPEQGDVMVNLLLILGRLQNSGLGKQCVRDLEARLGCEAQRVLASIYGQNSRAQHFWKSLGYSFAIDAQPVLDWYAKELVVKH